MRYLIFMRSTRERKRQVRREHGNRFRNEYP